MSCRPILKARLRSHGVARHPVGARNDTANSRSGSRHQPGRAATWRRWRTISTTGQHAVSILRAVPETRRLRLDPRQSGPFITGPCGVGKSWLARCSGYKACRENLPALHRVPRLFSLALGRGDGRYAKLIRQLGRVDLSLTIGDLSHCCPSSSATSPEIVEDRGDCCW